MGTRISASVKSQRRTRAIEMVEAAIREGTRCPTNDEIGSAVLPELAREGLFRIEVHAKNWRTVTAMQGPLQGKSTMRAPNGWAVYRVIDKNIGRHKSVNRVTAHADTAVTNRAEEVSEGWATDKDGNLTRRIVG